MVPAALRESASRSALSRSASTALVAALTIGCAPAPEASSTPPAREETIETTHEGSETMTRFDTVESVGDSVDILRELLTDTATRAAEGAPLELFREIGPTECVDPGNRGRGTHYVSLSYNLELADERAVAALQAIAEYWRSLDLELNTSRIDSSQPEVLAGRAGFAVRALAVPGSGRLNLAGDTPCLPNASTEGDA